MKYLLKRLVQIFLYIFVFAASFTYGQDLESIKLPAPQTEIGKPLMQALKMRHSSRSFSAKPLPLQELSNLLWAAYGVNRPESGKRTAPSAMNWQELDIYVVLPEGAFVYDTKQNILNPIIAGDLRALCGTQDFVKSAPLNIIYVTDLSRVTRGSEEDKMLYTAADCGFATQNVYLYCASQGLAVVVRGSIIRQKISEALKLKKDQKVMLAQTVGYPE